MKIFLFSISLMIAIMGLSAGAEAATHVLGAKKAALDPSTETVTAGYYSSTTLSAVDTDLTTGNIKSGVTIFGKLGTYTSTTSYALPDTAQTLCYDAAGGVITCPAHGEAGEQDGSYTPTAAQPSYTDNGDFTITDNRTGLMWKKCSEGQNNDAACTGTTGTYIWTAALSQCTGLTAPGGYTDWRLPNIRELMSIVDFGTSASARVNATYFPATSTAYYWSSTTYMPGTSNAWHVNFTSGGLGLNLKTNTTYIRCVRAGP